MNLIQNLEVRSAGNGFKPFSDDTNQVSYESCFKTTDVELASNNHQLVLGVDLGRSYFMHAILIVQDYFTSWEAYAH